MAPQRPSAARIEAGHELTASGAIRSRMRPPALRPRRRARSSTAQSLAHWRSQGWLIAVKSAAHWGRRTPPAWRPDATAARWRACAACPRAAAARRRPAAASRTAAERSPAAAVRAAPLPPSRFDALRLLGGALILKRPSAQCGCEQCRRVEVAYTTRTLVAAQPQWSPLMCSESLAWSLADIRLRKRYLRAALSVSVAK